MAQMEFRDRHEAGRMLANALAPWRAQPGSTSKAIDNLGLITTLTPGAAWPALCLSVR